MYCWCFGVYLYGVASLSWQFLGGIDKFIIADHAEVIQINLLQVKHKYCKVMYNVMQVIYRSHAKYNLLQVMRKCCKIICCRSCESPAKFCVASHAKVMKNYILQVKYKSCKNYFCRSCRSHAKLSL